MNKRGRLLLLRPSVVVRPYVRTCTYLVVLLQAIDCANVVGHGVSEDESASNGVDREVASLARSIVVVHEAAHKRGVVQKRQANGALLHRVNAAAEFFLD